MGDAATDYENNLRQQYDLMLNSIQQGMTQQAASASGGYEESGYGGGGDGESVSEEPAVNPDPFAELPVNIGENYSEPDITLEWNAKQGAYVPKYKVKPTSPSMRNMQSAAGTRERLSSFRASKKPLSTDSVNYASSQNQPLTAEENMLAEMVRRGEPEKAIEYIRGTYPGQNGGMNARGEGIWERAQRGKQSVDTSREKLYKQKVDVIVKGLPKEQRAEAKKHYQEQIRAAMNDPKSSHSDIVNSLDAIHKEQNLKVEVAKKKKKETATQKLETQNKNTRYVKKRTDEKGEYKPGENLVRGLASRRKGYASRGAWARSMRKEGFSETAINAAAGRLDSQGTQ